MTDQRLNTQHPITVEILSPVHIGDGSELIRDLDYVVQGNQTYVVSPQKAAELTLDAQDRVDPRLIGRPLSELLRSEDYRKSELFLYTMPNAPENRPLKTAIKTVWGQPYLPGSTLKGLFRNLTIWGSHVAKKQAPDLSPESLGRDRRRAGGAIERSVLGANPNLDLFRAVHIADTQPTTLDRLTVAQVYVYPTARGRNQGSGVIVDVEALRIGTTFTSRFSIDEYGFRNPDAAAKLGWARRQLDRVVAYGREFGRRRILEEQAYFRASTLSQTAAFYDKLAYDFTQLKDGQFIAQIGWGAGWQSKTLNDLLTANPKRFAEIVRTYSLKRNAEDFEPGDVFPKSRHLSRVGERPAIPVGWVRVSIG